MELAYCRLNNQLGHEAGRALLARLYLEETGKELPEIAVTERGKPYFPRSHWQFSITHTKHHAFCALSEKKIGIDAEELDRVVSTGLAEKILSPMELKQYAEAQEKNRALLTFWVLKEAQAKLTGKGLQGYPNDTEFSLDDPRVREIDGCLVAVMEEES